MPAPPRTPPRGRDDDPTARARDSTRRRGRARRRRISDFTPWTADRAFAPREERSDVAVDGRIRALRRSLRSAPLER